MQNVNTDSLKEFIINNDNIQDILETIGFSPKSKYEYLTMPNLDGDNPVAITVYKNTLNIVNHTRGYNGDILTLIQKSLDISFVEALELLVDTSGYNPSIQHKEDKCMSLLRELEKCICTNADDDLIVLDERLLCDYRHSPNKLWLDEGISVDIQEEFGICYDDKSTTIVIPIRDDKGNLVGIKNRKNTSENVYMKYYYSFPTKKNQLLYGLYKTNEHIIKDDYVIVVESEKSVMKLWQYGFKNSVALMGSLSHNQVKMLEKLNVKIVLAYDKDKTVEYIKKDADKFIVPVWYLWDKDDNLKDKDSPIDRGVAIFKGLDLRKVV
jgi:DNA primase